MNNNQQPISPKICLMGASLDTGNRGVSALAASLIKIIRTLHVDADIALLIGNRSSRPQSLRLSTGFIEVRVVNYRLSPRAVFTNHAVWILFLAACQRIMPLRTLKRLIVRSNAWLREVDGADFIGDIRGGDSFSDIYGVKKFVIGSLPSIIALLLKKELVLLPQTYGPYNSPLGRFIARRIIGNAAHLMSRDREGAEVAEALLGRRLDVTFCPDVAFMLDAVKPQVIETAPPLDVGSTLPLIGFNINGLMYNGGYTRDNMFSLTMDYRQFVKKMIQALIEQTTACILLVPHTFGTPGNVNSDPDACRDLVGSLAEGCRGRVHMLAREYDQSELKGIIGQCDFFIGSRMHACIAALSQGIPTVAVAYSRKFAGVFATAGISDMVTDARFVNDDEAVGTILSFLQNRNRIKAHLEIKVREIQKEIIRQFKEVILNS